MEKLTSLPFISIIIPAKNEEKLIRSCITSLNALHYPKEKLEIINILVLFNPMKIFLPISLLTFIITLLWGIPLILAGRGVSTGTLLGIVSTLIFFFLGLITEQLSQIRRNQKGNILDLKEEDDSV